MRKKFVIKILSLLLAISIALYGLLIAPHKIYAKDFELPSPTKTILNLCHLDTFEGGTGSRKQFILRIARLFERQNEGVLISVNAMTEEGYYFKKDSYDLVSFGVGVKVTGARPIDAENYYNSGVIDDKVYALPYMLGGYYIFSHTPINADKILDGAVVLESKYSSPFVAVALAGYSLKNYKVKAPIDAYTDFITGQSDYLIGTQRDINRIIARGEDFLITPLDGFSDLIQYLAITTTDAKKNFYAQKFATFLAENCSSYLTTIGMYSPYKNGLYLDGLLAVGEKISIDYTYHAFSDGALIKSINDALKNGAEIDENKKQIKKLLVYLDKKYRI